MNLIFFSVSVIFTSQLLTDISNSVGGITNTLTGMLPDPEKISNAIFAEIMDGVLSIITCPDDDASGRLVTLRIFKSISNSIISEDKGKVEKPNFEKTFKTKLTPGEIFDKILDKIQPEEQNKANQTMENPQKNGNQIMLRNDDNGQDKKNEKIIKTINVPLGFVKCTLKFELEEHTSQDNENMKANDNENAEPTPIKETKTPADRSSAVNIEANIDESGVKNSEPDPTEIPPANLNEKKHESNQMQPTQPS